MVTHYAKRIMFGYFGQELMIIFIKFELRTFWQIATFANVKTHPKHSRGTHPHTFCRVSH